LACVLSGYEDTGMSVVMLISDDEATTKRTRSTLEGMSMDVVVAANESDVTRLCAACRPSIVIADVEMPCGAGFEAIGTVRRLKRDAYIIAISRGNHQEKWLNVATACGADTYVPWPLTLLGLVGAIDASRTDAKWLPPSPDEGCLN
jgi:DNA-binding response OmpR family regulator